MALNVLNGRRKPLKQFKLHLVSLLVLGFGIGCGTPQAKRYPVVIMPTPELAGSSTLVDIVGAAPADVDDWQAYSINKYWQTGDARRRDAHKFTVKLGTGQQFELPTKNPIWDEWKRTGVDHLVIIADLPGSFQEGANDPRRKIISLYAKDWAKGTAQLKLEIQESRVRVLTPQAQSK